ncbi:PQQ-dependent sugar dehydrogenase [Microlunatus sp. GCM10028923]|uniref:PQQ-dependent sugar dehydrogenase n=1 Tax=Microlunatus sp. GCM10028923 TaxID=3273400 RepID=UPI00360E13E3
MTSIERSVPTGRPPDARTLSVQLVADGLDFPTGLAFLADGRLAVAEAGLPFGGARPGGRIRLIDPGGHPTTLADGLPWPVTGLTPLGDSLIISVPGALLRTRLDGTVEPLLEGLPRGGNYHTNHVAAGPDGWLYFGQGAMTNSGVVGLDGDDLGWLRRHDHPADVPGLDIRLAGLTYPTADPTDPRSMISTAAFSRFGETRPPVSRLPGRLPCTAAVLRCRPDGTELELVAWGTRNPYGLAFLPDGRLLAVDQGPDDRGSRPIGNAPDLLYEIRPGAWYGWPDFVGGDPVTAPWLRPERGEPPGFLLDHATLPPPEPALLRFPPHVAATRLAVGPEQSTSWADRLLVTLFGDERPLTAPAGPSVGRCLAAIDLNRGTISPLITDPLLRPIDVGFSPTDGSPYVVDFGRFEMGPAGAVDASPGTGRIWRVVDHTEGVSE